MHTTCKVQSLAALILLFQSTFWISGVPFIRQKSEFCGPAALASVLQYYGKDIDQESIAEEVFSPGLRGSLITDLEDYARKEGFSTELERGNREALWKNISVGRPVIVLVDTGFWFFESPHYLVATGYDVENIRVHTGYEADALWQWDRFQRAWERTGRLMLVVRDKSGKRVSQ